MARIRKFLSAIALAIGALFVAFKLGKREEAREGVVDRAKADAKSAAKVETKVAKAHARNDADGRSVDDRLRSKGKLRD